MTFLHDAGGCCSAPARAEPQLRIVVLNDAGGAIFGLLEHGAVDAAGRYGTAVERLFGTPHRVDLAALAAAYGVAHRPVSTTAELAEALAEPLEGRSIIEVRTDRHGLRELHRASGPRWPRPWSPPAAVAWPVSATEKDSRYVDPRSGCPKSAN